MTRPTIGARAETASRPARGLFRRADQTPSKTPRLVTTNKDDGCASRERMADRTCVSRSRDKSLEYASWRSAEEMSNRVGHGFMVHPFGLALLQAAAG